MGTTVCRLFAPHPDDICLLLSERPPSLFSCSPQSNRAARTLTIIKVANEKLKIHHRSRRLETFRLKKRKGEDPSNLLSKLNGLRERPSLPRGANRWPRMEYARRRGFRPRWWCVMWCTAGWKRVGTKENREEERKNARRICAGLCTSEGTPIA